MVIKCLCGCFSLFCFFKLLIDKSQLRSFLWKILFYKFTASHWNTGSFHRTGREKKKGKKTTTFLTTHGKTVWPAAHTCCSEWARFTWYSQDIRLLSHYKLTHFGWQPASKQRKKKERVTWMSKPAETRWTTAPLTVLVTEALSMGVLGSYKYLKKNRCSKW